MPWLYQCLPLVRLLDLYTMNHRDPQAAPALIGHLHEQQVDLFPEHQLDQHLAQDMDRLPNILNVLHRGIRLESSRYPTLWFLK
jgi:hypothetical protein